MAAVRTENKVVDSQIDALTDGGRFLSHRKVGRAFVVVFDVFPCALRFKRVEHVFEGTDCLHIVQNPFKFFGSVGF